MIGVRWGLAKKLKERNPATHCVIHRQALASKTLPQIFLLFTLLCEDLDSDQFFCSIQKYAGCPKATSWLAFMN
ncbi:unnamed protein product [Acanthoscelides obtectus]|uniref:Uncharacterized protein n=1 Tax=Acanthoscelides obtectus TaxID=200917 RepID=A0A9P0KFF2_ACAOB|nr:unnamed protein product [Acanthoscelides obtectus]CAK1647139.1 hypothetical protein AOBTE_LOCUS15070 [Acanthoscelides obtectus]